MLAVKRCDNLVIDIIFNAFYRIKNHILDSQRSTPAMSYQADSIHPQKGYTSDIFIIEGSESRF